MALKGQRAAVALSCMGMLAGAMAVPAAAAGTAAPVIGHGLRAPVNFGRGGAGSTVSTWSASNWSGYAETGTFTGVSGTWTVPSVAASTSATYSSAWIGVDGFSDSSLIQTGTEEDYYNGSAHYDAWWEILPAAETEISPSSYPVAPGDRMSAEIYETSTSTTTTTGHCGFFRRCGGGGGSSGHQWVIELADTTKGWSFTTTQAYTGPGSSAEWILEAPEVNGAIAPLANYTITPPTGLGDFDNAGVATTTVASGAPPFAGAALSYTNDAGVMAQGGKQVSTPSAPDTAGTAFNISYGATAPAVPAS